MTADAPRASALTTLPLFWMPPSAAAAAAAREGEVRAVAVVMSAAAAAEAALWGALPRRHGTGEADETPPGGEECSAVQCGAMPATGCHLHRS